MSAGAASEDITPRWPVRVTFRDRPPVTNVYHPISVKALAISDGRTPVVIVTADVCNFCQTIAERIYTRVAGLGLAPRQIVLNASHTHSGPAICPILDVVEPNQLDQPYQDFFVERVVSAVETALRNLRPAELLIGEATCDVCINKRLDGRMEPNPSGPMDHRVRILSVRGRKSRALRAVLFAYGCHPSDINDDSFGADFFGFARSDLEREYPSTVFLSAQGTGGDTRVDHRDASGLKFLWGNLSTIEFTRTAGARLAESVRKAMAARLEPVGGRINSAMREIQLPIENPPENPPVSTYSRDPWLPRWVKHFTELRERGAPIPNSVPYTIQSLSIGKHFGVVALDGEVFTKIGLRIEKALEPRRTFVFGYSNSMNGYIPTADEIPKGGYEIGCYYVFLAPAPFSLTVEETVVKNAVALAATKAGGDK
jgi:hypothetical protein